MKLEETRQILSILKTNYPQSFRNWDIKQSQDFLNLWAEAFKDEPVGLVATAVKSIIYSDTREFAPNIGQVKAMIHKISTVNNSLTEQEAWNLVYKALENSGYHAEEEFKKLPPTVQKIVGSPSVLKEWCMMNIDELNSVVASNFQRSYRARAKHEEEMQALPNSVKAVLGNMDHTKIGFKGWWALLISLEKIKEFDNITEFLNKNNIPCIGCVDDVVLECSAYKYPKDVRIFYQDIEYEWKDGNLNINHTGKFYYKVSWVRWDKTYIKQQHCRNQREVISLLKKIDKEFSKNYEQLTLL